MVNREWADHGMLPEARPFTIHDSRFTPFAVPQLLPNRIHRSPDVVGIVASPSEERVQPSPAHGGIQLRERPQLLSRRLLDDAALIDPFLLEDGVDRRIADVPRDSLSREIL